MQNKIEIEEKTIKARGRFKAKTPDLTSEAVQTRPLTKTKGTKMTPYESEESEISGICSLAYHFFIEISGPQRGHVSLKTHATTLTDTVNAYDKQQIRHQTSTVLQGRVTNQSGALGEDFGFQDDVKYFINFIFRSNRL